jgi:hypothetical protein
MMLQGLGDSVTSPTTTTASGLLASTVATALGSTPAYIMASDGTLATLQGTMYVPVGQLPYTDSQTLVIPTSAWVQIPGGAIVALTTAQYSQALQLLGLPPLSTSNTGDSATWIPGVPNIAVIGGAALLLILAVMK